MDQYAVDIRPGEVLQWLRDAAGERRPGLVATASKSYSVETDVDREAAGIGPDDDLAPVTASGVLTVAPQRGQRGWVLQLRARDSVGLKPVGPDEAYEDDDDLTVEAFTEQFLLPEKGEVEVVVLAEDEKAWQRFQAWLSRRRSADAHAENSG